MSHFNYTDIQKQFNRVIQYSQDIDNPKTDALFVDWYNAKKVFIDKMNGLIWQSPAPVVFEMDKESKRGRVEHWIGEIINRSNEYNNWLEKLACFLDTNIDGFFENKTVHEYVFYKQGEEITIPAGMRIGKALHRYFDDVIDYDEVEEIRNEMSRIIQENKVSGHLCISVHPLDFLSSSENNYNWRSCHALDGDYRAGNLSYMVDNCTIMAYIKGDEDTILPRFPEDVKWNNKKWRCLFFFDHDSQVVYSGRQYPFATQSALDIVASFLTTQFGMFAKNYTVDKWRENVFTEFEANGQKFPCARQLYMPHFGLYPLADVIKDHKDSMHFNDLLKSSFYLPQIYDYYYPSYFGQKRFSKPMIVGGSVNCLCCESRSIADSDKMLCSHCYDDGYSDEAEDYCAICGEPLYENDDVHYIEGLYPYCIDCYEACGENLMPCADCNSEIDINNPYHSHQTCRDGIWYCGPCEDRRNYNRRWREHVANLWDTVNTSDISDWLF